MSFHVHKLITCGILSCSEQLSSIPGLEDVTVAGVNQQQTAQTSGPAAASQSQTVTPAAGNLPAPEVDTQKYTQVNM